MITVEIFATLIGIAFILFVYTFLDLKNRLYGNIISGFLCGILCLILALSSAAGTVVLATQQIAYTSENTTGDLTNTSYVYNDPIMIQNTSLLGFFAFVGCAMILFSAYLIFEAYQETRQPLYVGEGKEDEDED